MALKRSTTTRDRHRAQIRRGRPHCGICKGEIDYTLHYLKPGAYVVDHIIPLALGGPDTIENKQAAHRHCNQQKAAKMPEEMAPTTGVREFVTSRTW
ncbi:HNH endonuclease [Agromyces tardus]|uniref:HNH endonuclease n=1 Tax=Agromyces tardus TaxID=2583849 RepID=UPI00361193DD